MDRVTVKRLVQLMLAALLALLLSAPAMAQARLTGEVVGSDGKPLKNVVIKMIPDDDSYPTLDVETNKKGKYVFGLLRNGTYRLVAFQEGMRTAHIDALVAKPDDPDFWSFEGDVPPGAEMPKFAVDGLSTVTYDLTMIPHDGPAGDYGTGMPENPIEKIVEALESGRAEQALVEARKVVDANPDNATAQYLYGFTLVSTGDAEGAETAARKVLEIDPSFEGGHSLLGRTLEAQGRTEEAVEAYEEQANLATTEQVRNEALLAAAVAHEKLGNDERATTVLEQLVEAGSTDPNVYKELADLYIRQDEPAKAREMMQRVTDMGESDPAVLYNLGAEKFNEGDFQGATEMFRRAIEADPDLADAYQQLAFALLNQGDRQGAIEALEMYLEKSPEETDATASARAIYEQLKKTP